ncbi:hypothetical protein HPB50_016171 [Hyalomma asiaticum]|uniref:Uncharacterized protein n=1 Tax=Hyalomma asiaticum TaxID=266040 RepID=A0ACB7RJH8_HYAAI|nr:hypothetical protein HPB50_016171 [Hyalomma asiaticum]
MRRVNADGSPWEPSAYSRVSSDHFKTGAPSRFMTHPDYVPSIFEHTTKKGRGSMARFDRVSKRQENAYTTLKQLLIRRLTPSEPQRLQQLLHDTELGDRTPSQLLRHMRQLLHTDGATTTDTDSRLLRELFLQRLPGNVRMILASAADKRLSELAELADSVLAVAPPSVAALQPDIAGRAPTTALHDIREQISRLADTVAAMQARSTPEERQRPAAQQKTCWYHRRYGNAARKCISPCDHAGNGSGRH